MLVLSRREKEIVRFPGLGITVEVVRIKGKTVRIGIDAPKEIRAVRGELDLDDAPHSAVADSNLLIRNDLVEIQQNLDAANLAIHLAQNQIRQGLADHADEVLEQAIACIEQLESCICDESGQLGTPAVVREKSPRYQVVRDPVVIILSENSDCPDVPIRLGEQGYRVVAFDDSLDVIDYLSASQQPKALLILSGVGEIDFTTRNENGEMSAQELKISGIGGLQLNGEVFKISNVEITGWYKSADHANAISKCLKDL